MQLKSKELTFYDIISKTDINRDDLEKIVAEMILNKEINARVRDFIIFFQKISEDKRKEELQKIKNDLQQKMSNIEKMIHESRFDKAIVDLNDVIDVAKSFELENIVNKASEKNVNFFTIYNCKLLIYN